MLPALQNGGPAIMYVLLCYAQAQAFIYAHACDHAAGKMCLLMLGLMFCNFAVLYTGYQYACAHDHAVGKMRCSCLL